MGKERKMTAKTKWLVAGLAVAAVVFAGLLIWAVTMPKPESAPSGTDPVVTTTLPGESTGETTGEANGETTNPSIETTASTEVTKPEETTETTKSAETTEATESVTEPEETAETAQPGETTQPEETTEVTEEASQPATQPEETEPEETTLPEVEPTEPEEMETVPEVTVPQETDPVTGEETGITFPSQIPGHSLVIEKLAPYSGMYVEDGTNAQIKDVAMLLVKNTGSETLEYARITVQYGEEELLFQVSALPAGERAVVQAQQRKAVPQGKPTGCTALVAEGNTAGSFAPEVKVTDNGDGSITVENLTKQPIPAVRVFYKYYMEDADVFVGGITFTLKLTNLEGKAAQTLRPSHYSKDSSQIVTVAIYDADK